MPFVSGLCVSVREPGPISRTCVLPAPGAVACHALSGAPRSRSASIDCFARPVKAPSIDCGTTPGQSAVELGLETEAAQLDALIGTLLGTRRSRLDSPVAIARGRGRPYDPGRMELFHMLHQALRNRPPSVRPAPPRGMLKGRSTLAFFEAYFSACGAKTRLNCPCCDTRMLRVRQADLTLDVCKRCKGVWFDHHELEAIWEMERDRLLTRGRGGKVARTTEVGSEVLFETVFWAPDLIFVGAHAAGHTVVAAAEAAPIALEAAGDAAASVFETILEIVAGIFG